MRSSVAEPSSVSRMLRWASAVIAPWTSTSAPSVQDAASSSVFARARSTTDSTSARRNTPCIARRRRRCSSPALVSRERGWGYSVRGPVARRDLT